MTWELFMYPCRRHVPVAVHEEVCCIAETSDGSEPEESASGMNTSDKEDPSGAADLLAGLSQGQVVALRTTRSERPHPAPQTYAASIESAINPWMDASACSGQTVVAHDFVNGIGSEENKARRSLMHRCDHGNSPTIVLVQQLDRPCCSITVLQILPICATVLSTLKQ